MFMFACWPSGLRNDANFVFRAASHCCFDETTCLVVFSATQNNNTERCLGTSCYVVEHLAQARTADCLRTIYETSGTGGITTTTTTTSCGLAKNRHGLARAPPILLPHGLRIASTCFDPGRCRTTPFKKIMPSVPSQRDPSHDEGLAHEEGHNAHFDGGEDPAGQSAAENGRHCNASPRNLGCRRHQHPARGVAPAVHAKKKTGTKGRR